MKKLLFATVFTLFFSFGCCWAQKIKQIDSLLTRLKGNVSDSEMIVLNSQVAELYRGNEPDSSEKYCNIAFALCDKYNLPDLKIKSTNTMAINYCIKGDYNKGREYFIKYLQLALKSGDAYNIGNAYGNIGITYNNQGIYDKTLEYYLKALPFMERSGRKDGIANVTGNIGTVYLQLQNTKNAALYLNKAVAYLRALGDSAGLISNYTNLASLNSRDKNYTSALVYIDWALQIAKSEEDKHTYAVTLIDKADIFCELKNYSQQLLLLKEAEELLIKQKDEPNLAQVYEMYGRGYIGLADYKNAEFYLLKATELAHKTDFLTIEASSYEALVTCYKKQQLFEKALAARDMLGALKDSLYNSQSSEQVAQMQTRYETEKKEQENKALQEKNESASKTIKQQIYIVVAIGVICILLTLGGFMIYRSNKQKQKANIELTRKNIMIEKQKEIVEEKQKEILDSIHYAKRIQRALLPHEKYIERNIKEVHKI
jgi:tetratricopeptide (TPR) repeat protein